MTPLLVLRRKMQQMIDQMVWFLRNKDCYEGCFQGADQTTF